MGKSPDIHDRYCTPIDVMQFHRRLSYALFQEHADRVKPADLCDIPFPSDLTDVNRFRDDYLVKEIVRKYPGFDLGVDRKAVALETLMKGEESNKATNERLSAGISGCPNPDVWQIFQSASRKAISVLGRFDWEALLKGARHGPRATTRVSGDAGLEPKLCGVPHVTASAYNLALEVLRLTPQWLFAIAEAANQDEENRAEWPTPQPSAVDLGKVLIIQEYDEVTSVPKNAKTDRIIAIQPDMNVYLQLGVGTLMRERLWKVGINLNDQSINQRRARAASRGGENATVDLKNASGSITSELVWQFLGNHSEASGGVDLTWYRVLDALRTTCGLVEGQVIEWELFSSMGNGYTFELESLIFWAIAHETCLFLGITPDVTVYGDDLILPSSAVALLREVFAYCGFQVNEDKTFSDLGETVFRESCGKHYLGGVDVTPVYVSDGLDTVEQIVLLANNLVRWARWQGYGRDGRIQPVYDWVVSHLHPRVRQTAIPLGEANDGLIKSFDEHCPKTVRQPVSGAFLGHSCKTVSTSSRKKLVSGAAGYVIWHYGRSYARFTPPGELRKWGGRPAGFLHLPQIATFSEYVWWDIPVSQLPYKRPTSKRSIRFGKRTVSSWADPGPWI
jgi:hypothetical protein